MTNEEKARALFMRGYNCAQSVFAAFAEQMKMDELQALRLACGLGGGVGGRREMCGAVSGMIMAYGALRGYDTADDLELKAAHYASVRQLVEAFEDKFGTVSCRKLLGLDEGVKVLEPSARTQEYYDARPCPEIVPAAAAMLERWLQEHPKRQEDTGKTNESDQ